MNEAIIGSKLFGILSKDKKICLMGIGNFDRADDYTGGAVIDRLQKEELPENVSLINAGPVPESFTGVIKKEQPDILMIIDAARMDKPPGTIQVFTEDKIDTVFMYTPHRTPMTMFTKYLRFFLEDLETLFIGVEPVSLEYNTQMSDLIKERIKFLSDYLTELLQTLE
jgi:hydrogenase 3 maturation protease